MFRNRKHASQSIKMPTELPSVALTKERSKQLQSKTMSNDKANAAFKTKPANQER